MVWNNQPASGIPDAGMRRERCRRPEKATPPEPPTRASATGGGLRRPPPRGRVHAKKRTPVSIRGPGRSRHACAGFRPRAARPAPAAFSAPDHRGGLGGLTKQAACPGGLVRRRPAPATPGRLLACLPSPPRVEVEAARVYVPTASATWPVSDCDGVRRRGMYTTVDEGAPTTAECGGQACSVGVARPVYALLPSFNLGDWLVYM